MLLFGLKSITCKLLNPMWCYTKYYTLDCCKAFNYIFEMCWVALICIIVFCEVHLCITIFSFHDHCFIYVFVALNYEWMKLLQKFLGSKNTTFLNRVLCSLFSINAISLFYDIQSKSLWQLFGFIVLFFLSYFFQAQRSPGEEQGHSKSRVFVRLIL